MLHLQLGSPLGIALNHAQFVLERTQSIALDTNVSNVLINGCIEDIIESVKTVKEFEPILSRYVHEDVLATAIFEVKNLITNLVDVKYKLMSVSVPTTMTSVTNPINMSAARSNFKIPTVKIPIFEGKLEEWNSFWGTFSAIIDSDITIPAVVKFNYLLNYLQGDALLVAKSYPISEQNYALVKAKLASCYGDSNKILNKLMVKFTNLTAPEDNLQSLRLFSLNYQAILAQGGTLLNPSGSENLVKTILMQKLPALLQRQIVEYHKGTNFTLEQFGQAIEHLVSTYEYLETFENESPKVK